jgi:lipopolysaccharide exporter
LKKYFSSYWIRSAFYSFLQKFSINLFGIANYILLVREGLTKPEMGLWALFLVVANLFESTKGHLLKNAHIRFIVTADESEKPKIASSAFALNMGVSFLFILLLVFFSGPISSVLNNSNDLENLLLWFIPGVIAIVLFSHLEAVAQSHLDFKAVFSGYFARQMVFLCILIYHEAFAIHFSLVDLVIFQFVSVLIGALVLLIYSRKYLHFSFTPSVFWMKKIIGFGRYIFGSSVLANIFGSIDQLLIAGVTNKPGFVASYNAASRINSFIDTPSYAAAEVLLPKHQLRKARKRSNTSTKDWLASCFALPFQLRWQLSYFLKL